MAESTSSFSSVFLLLLVFLVLSPSPSTSDPHTNRGLSAIQTNTKTGKNNRISIKCCEMRTRSQCSVNPRCRWCRSNVLDDSCFSKAEARRLPNQVFLCDS